MTSPSGPLLVEKAVQAFLRAHLSADMLYTIQVGETLGYFYLLLVEDYKKLHSIAVHLVAYNGAIMRHHVAQHGGKLPMTIHKMLYTGPQSLGETFRDSTVASSMLTQDYPLAPFLDELQTL